MEIEDCVLLNIEDIQRGLIEKIAVAEQEANEAKQEAGEAKREADEARRKTDLVELEAIEAKCKVALKLWIKGMTTKEIVDITGLSLKEVEII
jgi:hypothetical protein